jgi:hypothetical protein
MNGCAGKLLFVDLRRKAIDATPLSAAPAGNLPGGCATEARALLQYDETWRGFTGPAKHAILPYGETMLEDAKRRIG